MSDVIADIELWCGVANVLAAGLKPALGHQYVAPVMISKAMVKLACQCMTLFIALIRFAAVSCG
jgi:hypothetical protein